MPTKPVKTAIELTDGQIQICTLGVATLYYQNVIRPVEARHALTALVGPEQAAQWLQLVMDQRTPANGNGNGHAKAGAGK